LITIFGETVTNGTVAVIIDLTPFTKLCSGDSVSVLEEYNERLNNVLSGDRKFGRHLSLVDYLANIQGKGVAHKGPCDTN
jgi:hypothetical protein